MDSVIHRFKNWVRYISQSCFPFIYLLDIAKCKWIFLLSFSIPLSGFRIPVSDFRIPVSGFRLLGLPCWNLVMFFTVTVCGWSWRENDTFPFIHSIYLLDIAKANFSVTILNSGFRIPDFRVAHLLTVEIPSFAAGSVPNFRLSTDTALAKFLQKLNVSFTS